MTSIGLRLVTSNRITLGSLGVAAVVLIIPLMQGGLLTVTLPVLSALVAAAFLAESRRFLFEQRRSWREVAPWVYVWLGVSLYIFGQAAVRELFHLELTVNDVEFTRVYWLQHVKYWAFFTAYWLLAWIASRQRARSLELIVVAVIAMALFQSLQGSLALVAGQTTAVSGTFYNKNHLAGFLAVAVTLGSAYLMPQRTSFNARHLPVFRLALLSVFLLIVGAALIGTASRFGIFSACVGFLVWIWLYGRIRPADNRRGYIWLGLLIVLPVLAALWFGPDKLIERLFRLDDALDWRLTIWRAMLGVPVDVWIQGVGAGAFHDVFKLIQPPSIGKSVWRAHSEYLQLAFEFGLIGIALLSAVAVYWINRCRPTELDSLKRGALAGIIAVLVHNIADFDMQVPGTAVVFWIAVGILFSRRAERATGRTAQG